MRKSQEDLVLITHQYRDVCRQARLPESTDFQRSQRMLKQPLYDKIIQPKLQRKAFNQPKLKRTYTSNKQKLELYKKLQKEKAIKVRSSS
jgi:hypothetical protein